MIIAGTKPVLSPLRCAKPGQLITWGSDQWVVVSSDLPECVDQPDSCVMIVALQGGFLSFAERGEMVVIHEFAEVHIK